MFIYAVVAGAVSAIFGAVCNLSARENFAAPAAIFSGLITFVVSLLIIFIGQPYFTHWADTTGGYVLLGATALVVASAVTAYGSDSGANAKAWGITLAFGAVLLVGNLAIVPPVMCVDSQIRGKADIWKVVGASQEFHDTDLDSLLRVTPENAVAKAKDKMPSDMGSYLEIGTAHLQLVNKHPYYIVDLKIRDGQWRGFLNRGGVVPGYLVVDALNKDAEAEFRGGYAMKYVDSPRMFYEFELDRYFYLNWVVNSGMIWEDLGTLEVDDNWQPFYTATGLKHVVGYTGNEVVGTAVIDPQTGDITYYELEEVPEWIDIIWTRDIIRDYANWWGEFHAAEAICSLWNSAGRRDVDKVNDVFAGDDELWWQVTFTSKGNDSTVTEIVYVNPKTGESLRYDVSESGLKNISAIDDLMDTASKRLSTEGFEPEQVEIQNIFGEPVYYGILNGRGGNNGESSGAYSGVSFVRVKDANNESAVIVASNLEDAYRQLQQAISNDRSDDPTLSGQTNTLQIEGTVTHKSVWEDRFQIRVDDTSGGAWYILTPTSDDAGSYVQVGQEVSVTVNKGSQENWLYSIKIYIIGEPMFEFGGQVQPTPELEPEPEPETETEVEETQ
ncbi:hypothetical protein GW755_03925 [bacterium]|nr:hypothetical protein [bacterium]